MADSWSNSIKSWVPENDQQPFKIAFYNAVVLSFLACCIAVVAAVFFLLQAVLKSMLWAVLCGTVLFPFKKRLTTAIEGYLVALKESGTPLFIGVLVAPLATVDRGAEALWSAVVSKSALAFLIVYMTGAALAYESNFTVLWRVALAIYNFLDSVVWLYSCGWVRSLAVIYGLCFIGYVYLIGADANKVAVRALSVPLWFVALCSIAQFFGPVRVFVAVASAVVILLIVIRVVDTGETSAGPEGQKTEGETDQPKTHVPDTNSSVESVSVEETGESFGNRCIRAIIGACSLLWVTEHPSAVALLLLLFIYGILKRTGEYFDLRQRATAFLCGGSEMFRHKFSHVLEVLFPSTLRQFFKLLFYGDRHIMDGLQKSAGTLSTIFVMVVLLLSSILFGGFLIFQLQSEAVHLIGLTSNVINQSFSGKVQLSSWVSQAMNVNDLSESGLDDVVENAYQYGRNWLPAQARMLVKGEDKERADMMEAQVKMIVDKLFEAWKESRAGGGQEGEDTKAVAVSGSPFNQLWDHLQGSTDIRALGMDLVQFVKENISMLTSILETVWHVMSANLTFLYSISAAVLSLVLSFGLELLNCFIGILVFLTMLYYLLAYSQSEWLPIEWLTTFTPGGGSTENPFSKSVEIAISNVFVLSFKMALFYGLYTWFIHTLFALNVVFIPSILAATFAAVPFLAPYWVCVPGAIELGLVRGEPFSAVLFFVFGFAPCMLVDSAFYREVKGSHPYLTGLSVVGGIYWLGMEGAFVGPILLCCMLVMMDMYKNVLPR